MIIDTFDTSCVLNLLRPDEQPNEDLLRLIQLGLSGKVQIRVTPVAHEEIDSGFVEGHESRPNVRKRLEQFPISDISSERTAERDRKAYELLALLWPNLQPGSENFSNCLRDCKHLASHFLCGGSVFVTLDTVLHRKAQQHKGRTGIDVLNPAEALNRQLARDSGIRNQPSDIAVRKARDDDFAAIKELLEPLKHSYPDFDDWLHSSIHNPNTIVSVGIVHSEIAGIAVWKPKDQRVVKLATFYIAPKHRSEGLGQHLLFHQIRAWINRRFDKAIVTVSNNPADLVSFFCSYGFKIEGASMRRYHASEAEMVLAKHFLYQRVDETDKERFADKLVREIYSLPEHKDIRESDNWFIPPVAHHTLVARWIGQGASTSLQLGSEHGFNPRLLSLSDLEETFYPVRFAFRGRDAYMIPIQPRWADRLMRITRAQMRLFGEQADKLLLRTDNVYYCCPRYDPAALKGAPVLFYVSDPDMVVAGMGRILECRVAEPEDLFLEYSDMGIYGLNDIRRHVRTRGHQQGQAMALRFGWWVPFPRPIGKDRLQEFGTAYPQTITAISYDKFERITSTGGIDW
jgi:N-acetylglutamate synthase-like GNAT family acetyltransferase